MNRVRGAGYKALFLVEDFGLFTIAVLTVVAMGIEIWSVIINMHVSLSDLLLLFIYLEVLAMVGLYLKSGRLPVRMPLYIVIVALARYMILDMKNLDTYRMLGLSGAILIITIAILAIRYGHTKYPYGDTDKNS
ncbi:phosphate-starvation-inducible PsiE family protein [Vibrio sp. S17_S38]|uniref:phosphate-starvation-inducible protein PsiE n=1 Tax=Vibrio sp. S17_S38 TaxID=2720229 RepID=UPI00168130C0|nr:phosphate-starvation-inducible PsiE family protein [Vibrio sp. S17_S38]MBD1574195.1 phosphate-starvation-inducible PsiE family protein [Vibrio sp. S17_S38]